MKLSNLTCHITPQENLKVEVFHYAIGEPYQYTTLWVGPLHLIDMTKQQTEQMIAGLTAAVAAWPEPVAAEVES